MAKLLTLLLALASCIWWVQAAQPPGSDGMAEDDEDDQKLLPPQNNQENSAPVPPKRRELPEHIAEMLTEQQRLTLTEQIKQTEEGSSSGKMVASTRLQSFLAEGTVAVASPTLWQSLWAAIGRLVYGPVEYLIRWIFYPRPSPH